MTTWNKGGNGRRGFYISLDVHAGSPDLGAPEWREALADDLEALASEIEIVEDYSTQPILVDAHDGTYVCHDLAWRFR